MFWVVKTRAMDIERPGPDEAPACSGAKAEGAPLLRQPTTETAMKFRRLIGSFRSKAAVLEA